MPLSHSEPTSVGIKEDGPGVNEAVANISLYKRSKERVATACSKGETYFQARGGQDYRVSLPPARLSSVCQ